MSRDENRLADAARTNVELERYLEALDGTPEVEDRLQKRILKRLAPASVRPMVLSFGTDLVRPVSGRHARRLASQRRPVLVHLGSGRTLKPNWINVDLIGKGADVSWNLRRQLPFDDDTIDAVFHEHLLEHLTLAEGYGLTRDVLRVLRPGGRVRVAVPDAERYVRSYATADDELERLRPGRPTPMLALQEVFFRFGHRSAYDTDTLCFLLTASGFEGARRCRFGETELSEIPDSEHRRPESIYVEASKPASG